MCDAGASSLQSCNGCGDEEVAGAGGHKCVEGVGVCDAGASSMQSSKGCGDEEVALA